MDVWNQFLAHCCSGSWHSVCVSVCCFIKWCFLWCVSVCFSSKLLARKCLFVGWLVGFVGKSIIRWFRFGVLALWGYISYESSGVLTSCSTSWAAIALRTFFFDVSCISPPTSSSSSIKYAFSKLKMISNSQTYGTHKSYATVTTTFGRGFGLSRFPDTYTTKVLVQQLHVPVDHLEC